MELCKSKYVGWHKCNRGLCVWFLWSRKPLEQIVPVVGYVKSSPACPHRQAKRDWEEEKARKRERETAYIRTIERCSQVETSSVVTAMRNIRVETELDSIVKRETMARMLDSCSGSGIESTSAVDTKLPHFLTCARTRSPNLRQLVHAPKARLTVFRNCSIKLYRRMNAIIDKRLVISMSDSLCNWTFILIIRSFLYDRITSI